MLVPSSWARKGSILSFFLVASYMNPHDICLWAMNKTKGYQKYPIPQTPSEQCPPIPESFEVPHDEPTVLRLFYMTRHSEQKSFDEERWRQYLKAYYWMIETVDADISRLLEALKDNGFDKNTLIVFSSDHGDGLAAHQWLGKCCHYEEAVRVPFIVCFTDAIEPGRVDGQHLLSSGPDFYATALDYAGVEVPLGCQGRSRRDLMEQKADANP